MWTLYDRWPRKCRFDNRSYRLHLSFDRVLRVFDVQNDEVMTDAEKVDTALYILVGRKRPKEIGEAVKLFSHICRTYIDVIKSKKDGKRSLDFKQDAPYIYAAFYQCYGIDLEKQIGKLHWWAFLNLFRGLADDTRMMQIVSIRTRPLPKPTKYNAEERARIMRAKAEYALDIPEDESQRRMAQAWNNLADMMKSMASNKDG